LSVLAMSVNLSNISASCEYSERIAASTREAGAQRAAPLLDNGYFMFPD
jgi:hypothetical protein